MKKIDYSLYLCTERSYLQHTTLPDAVEQAILGGCTMVQLREKDCSTRAFYNLAKELKMVTDQYQVPLLINDRVDIALAVDAAGVHLGQSDLPVAQARRILGAEKIIGATAKTVEQAIQAQKEGASYLGVGAIYPSPTKKDAKGITQEELCTIRQSVDIPIVAIGGITAERLKEVKSCGVDGVAVISAILDTQDIRKAAENLKNIVKVQPGTFIKCQNIQHD
ncbi:MAG: thiamine phosphate synthase [Lachnospiraceae bacterium]|nr:thiamine phosphate synthase [Lachnospiraceae bacterium]